MGGPHTLEFTPDGAANRLIGSDPLALLIGMVLYQQIPVEKAFVGPLLLQERLGGKLDAAAIAAMEPEALTEVFREKPALHRFPANMAKRVQALCSHLVDHHSGDPADLWGGAGSADELLAHLNRLPGFGEYKSRVLIGVLGHRLAIRPEGWESLAPDWPSVADVAGFDDVAVLKERKKAWKDREQAG